MHAFQTATLGLLALATSLLGSAATAQERLDPELLEAMEARAIGPAGMSGRVAVLEVLPSDPRVIYAGAASGGLWKSTDEGLTWEPIFDDQPTASIGAVAVHPVVTDVVWVGTGEGNPRNSSSVGKGLFKSVDGGQTWQALGLEKTERIHRILLHPTDPNIAYVAALGTTWGENPERGVFKTTDGGATFEKVLFVDERTGCADLVMDPGHPDKLFAAMWDHRRTPDFMRSGGPGSGLHRSLDGGATWTRIEAKDGLPKGELGRIGVAFAPSNPRVVYALVEAEESALCRSDDGGFHWRKVNTDTDISPRPFYYADLRVDTKDPERVYRLESVVSVSEDGGATFRQLMPWSLVHPDHHAFWIHPDDPQWLVDGNDGGIAISKNHGETWRFVTNLPLAQFYHVGVDMQVPFNVYGGLQDNGSWRGPSDVWENGGIRNHHWQELGFGDGFATLPIPGDPESGYAMSQGGALMRWNATTGERRMIRPALDPDDEAEELRFNWNAGIAIDPFAPDTVYYGSQYLHRSLDRGHSWERISPDLTTDNPEWQRQKESGGLTLDVTDAENHTSILTIAPSALEQGVIWVGTDDGRIHVTRDGGGSWTSVEENLLGVPRNTWVPHIEASKFDSACAFVVLDDHRRSNWTTYAYRTDDYGATWRSIATDEIDGYVHVIEQDPVDEDLLFLGTEFGLWVSTDGGQAWFKWTHGLPTVAVRALVVHPRDHDLVVATYGRALFVLDDIRPLREMDAETLAEPVHLFDVPPVIQHPTKQTGASRFPANTEFRGETRARGALISFWLDVEEKEAESAESASNGAEAPSDGDGDDEEDDEEDAPELKVEILDGEGDVLRTLRPDPRNGLNRVVWRLDRSGRPGPGGAAVLESEPGGPPVLPGTYTIHVHYGDEMDEGTIEVLADPRRPVDLDARRQNFALRERLGELGELIGRATRRIDEAREDIDVVRAVMLREDQRAAREAGPGESPDSAFESLREAADALDQKLEDLRERLRGPEDVKGIQDIESLLGDWRDLSWEINSSYDAPGPSLVPRVDVYERGLRRTIDELEGVLNEDVRAFADRWREEGPSLFPILGPI